MIGEPSSEGCQSIPANLSGSLEPKRAETCFWCSVSMLTQNRPLDSMAFHDRDTLVGQNSTSGGSSDSAAKDWQAKPTGTSSWMVVMIVIPVQNWPSTLRNVRGSIGAAVITSNLTLEAAAEVVAPQADRGALPGNPSAVFDLPSHAAEFDVEPAGRLHVEGQHQVVDVAAQRRRHRHFAAQCPIQAQAHVVGLFDLDHQVHDAARGLPRHEGQAVVTRIAAQEAQPRRRPI